jgi:hypothetical protein
VLVENPQGFLQDTAVLAVAGAYQSPVLFEAPTETVLDGRAETKRYSIVYPANALGSLQWQSTVVVGGVTYSVLAVHDLDDGNWQRADLESVA